MAGPFRRECRFRFECEMQIESQALRSLISPYQGCVNEIRKFCNPLMEGPFPFRDKLMWRRIQKLALRLICLRTKGLVARRLVTDRLGPFRFSCSLAPPSNHRTSFECQWHWFDGMVVFYPECILCCCEPLCCRKQCPLLMQMSNLSKQLRKLSRTSEQRMEMFCMKLAGIHRTKNPGTSANPDPLHPLLGNVAPFGSAVTDVISHYQIIRLEH